MRIFKYCFVAKYAPRNDGRGRSKLCGGLPLNGLGVWWRKIESYKVESEKCLREPQAPSVVSRASTTGHPVSEALEGTRQLYPMRIRNMILRAGFGYSMYSNIPLKGYGATSWCSIYFNTNLLNHYGWSSPRPSNIGIYLPINQN